MADVLDKVNEVISKVIRPALNSHRGDIEITGFNDGVLEVRLLGRCSGCPSASLGTREFILNELKSRVPEVSDVALYTPVSGELMDMARRILDRHKGE